MNKLLVYYYTNLCVIIFGDTVRECPEFSLGQAHYLD